MASFETIKREELKQKIDAGEDFVRRKNWRTWAMSTSKISKAALPIGKTLDTSLKHKLYTRVRPVYF